MYYTDGLFVRSFGEGTLKLAWDITAANEGRAMAVDWKWDDTCVHIFSEDGHHLDKFKLQGPYYHSPRIAFHHLSEHVIIASKKEEPVVVEIFTKDGNFVRSTQIHEVEEQIDYISRMTVSRNGRIALLLQDINAKWKVLVI